jgi:ATP-dependent Lon protease
MPGKGPDAHRQARRRDAGVGAGGDELRPVEGRRVPHPEEFQPGDRRPHPHPRGAIPKRRPVGGITLATSLVSALQPIPIRKDVAMTGEITLRGKVLPIGGVKEKILAAHRSGLKTIIVPRENEKDLADIPKNVLDSLNVYMVESMDEVLKIALAEPLDAIAAPAAEPIIGDQPSISH